MRKTKVWFITGASRGLGRTWTEAALARGDRVAAAVRDTTSMSDLKDVYGDSLQVVHLDVSVRSEAFKAVEEATLHFATIDVLINNAGYCQAGALEELDEHDVRQSFDTNVFGCLWVTQAMLPIMRKQGSGHIISVSSVSGLIGQPTIGIYNSSKWAVEGMMEALSHEVAGHGIKVSLLEPAIFATSFTSSASMRLSDTLDAYNEARVSLRRSLESEPVNDPRASVEPLFSLVDSDAPPLRLLLGDHGLRWAIKSCAERITTWVR